MKKNINKKRISLFAFMLFFGFALLFLVGCQESNSGSSITKLSNTMTTLCDTLSQIKSIDNDDLIVKDFMSDEYNSIDYTELSYSNNKLNSYFGNITKLNNIIVDTIKVNDMVTTSKINLISKSNQIKFYCAEIKREKREIGVRQLQDIDSINSSILTSINKIKLTKNEVINNLMNVKAIKDDYSSKTFALGTKYNSLKGSLNTRLAFFTELEVSLSSIFDILCDNDCCSDTSYYVPSDYEDKTVMQTQADYNDNKENKENKPSKERFKKNIDTYEYAGKNNPYKRRYDNDTYYINGQIGYPYYGNGYNNMYSYGYNGMYGLPYGFGGYLYPNVNTYRGIRNIDTYRLPRFNNPPYFNELNNDKEDKAENDLEQDNKNNNEIENDEIVYGNIKNNDNILIHK